GDASAPSVDDDDENVDQVTTNEFILQLFIRLQEMWLEAGCPRSLVNHLDSRTVAVTNMTVNGEEGFAYTGLDIFYVIYQHALALNTTSETLEQALPTLFADHLQPTIDRKSSGYCGNCGGIDSENPCLTLVIDT